MSVGKNAKSSKVNNGFEWNYSLILNDTSAEGIKKDLEKTEIQINEFVSKWEKDDTYLKDVKRLKLALDEYDSLVRNFGTSGNSGYYVWLKHSVEQDNNEIKALLNQVEEFSNKMSNRIQFFGIRLAKVSSEYQELFVKSVELEEYRHYLEKLFLESKYLLSEAEEKILVLKSGPSHGYWTRMVSTFISREERRGKTLPLLISELQSTTKSTRDAAAKDVNEIMSKYADTAEQELNAILANKKIDDELRGFTRPDMARHLSDDIDSDVVDAMTSAVTSRFDIPERFYGLKAKMLGVKKIAYHERSVPYGEVSEKFSFEKSVDLVRSTFANLDQQFVEILDGYINNGQIDVYPKKGKRGGAFCADDLPIHPTFVMLNHTDQLNDVLTLAHEMGHGINNELMKSQTKAVNFGSPLSTAEVASTFMEDFVLKELLKTADDKTRLAIYVRKLDDDIASIFRQVAAYNFEKALHAEFRAKGFLSKEQIGEIFRKHMSSYMGKHVSQDEGSQNWWVYWSHFRSFFYVYSYASGLLISKSLQAQVKENHEFMTSVKKILSAGSSDSPKNIFAKNANIDITDANFWTKGIKEVELLLSQAEKLWEEVK